MSQRQNTNNSIPSNALADLNDNTISLDEFINSTAATTTDRFNNKYKTVKQLVKDVEAQVAAAQKEGYVKIAGDRMTGNLAIKRDDATVTVLNNSNAGMAIKAEPSGNVSFNAVTDGNQQLKWYYNKISNQVIFSNLNDVKINGKSVLKQGEDGIPVGHMYWGLNLETGSLHLNGELYSRSAYAELWKYITTVTPHLLVSDKDWLAEKEANNGICNKFSSGNGSTTFRLPIFNYVKGGGLGYQKAGLPNITGVNNPFGIEPNLPKSVLGGAFYVDPDLKSNAGLNHTTSQMQGTVMFDASRANSIYGSSSSVDVQAVNGFWQIKAIGQISDLGSTEITNMINQINLLKEQLTNQVHLVDSYVSKDNLSWYRKWSDGFIEQAGVTADLPISETIVNLLTPMKTNAYNVQLQILSNLERNEFFNPVFNIKTNSFSVRLRAYSGNAMNNTKSMWIVRGY